MTAVGTVDGLKYGFRYLAILVGVLLLAGAFIAGGGALAYSGLDVANPTGSEPVPVLAGGFVALVGVVGLHGMVFGLLYKFVADSVVAGVEASDLQVAVDEDLTLEAAELSVPVATGRSTATEAPATAADAAETDVADADEAAPTDTSPAVDGPDATDSSPPADDRSAEADAAVDAEVETVASGAAEPGGRAEGGTGGPAEPTGEELDRVVSEATGPGATPGSEDEQETGPELFGEVEGTADEEPVPASGAGHGQDPSEGVTADSTEGAAGERFGSESDDDRAEAPDGSDGPVPDETTEDRRAASAETDAATADRPDDGSADPDLYDLGPEETDASTGLDSESDLATGEAGPTDREAAMDEAFEEAEEATDVMPEFGDAEPATDESGDWEPLDESDLKD